VAETKRFLLQDSSGCAEVVKTLAQHFRLSREPSIRARQIFYDTFDWRLHKKNLILLRVADEYHLHSSGEKQALLHLKMPAKKQPRFWWEFPEGPMREVMQKAATIRAILPLVEVESELQTVRIFDARGRAKWRVQIQHARVADAQNAAGTFCLLDFSALYDRAETGSELQALLAKLGAR